MKKILLTICAVIFININANLDQSKIAKFIFAQNHHNPNQLPSSWQLHHNKKPANLMWSILIPTLVERNDQFKFIFTKLMQQIDDANLQDKVEIVFFRDNREAGVGFKRNKLIENASGKYTCFVDDDDDVHDEYIPMIYNKLLEGKDCVKLVGIYHWIGHYKQPFIHSIKYNSYFAKNKVYYRPPNHLNPILRSITTRFRFIDERNHGEDTDWAMRICKSKIIKTESSIEEPYYLYNFDDKKSATHNRLKKAKIQKSRYY
jgi:glycosyltransferase involved in cell wall biosynthesis